MDTKSGRTNSWVRKKYSDSGGPKCWRCQQKSKRGCCLKKPTPCGKGECVVCLSPQQADGACATPTVTKRSSRIPRQAPVAATAGSGLGEKKPKYDTQAARKQAQRERKIKREQHEKKKEKQQQQQ